MPNDSFFNFFAPPDCPEDESKLDEESQNILATDFEIGHFLRARIIPRAVLFFTGDLIDDDESGKFLMLITTIFYLSINIHQIFY